jgi:hypothetical protein
VDASLSCGSEETERLFDRIAKELVKRFGYSYKDAIVGIRGYYADMCEKALRRNNPNAMSVDDWFAHDGAFGMALRIHYVVGIGGNADSPEYLKWRSEFHY